MARGDRAGRSCAERDRVARAVRVFAVAAAVVVYLLGRRLFGRIAGLVAAGLYLANFLQMGVAQLARSSSLELFLLALSWYALFAALTARGSARRWWALFVASSVLA